MKKNFIMLLTVGLIISGCSDTWLGESSKKVKHPGKRISVLEIKGSLNPSTELKENVIVPKQEINKNWPISDTNQNILKEQNFSLNENLSEISSVKFKTHKSFGKNISPIIINNNLIINNQKQVIAYGDSGKTLWTSNLEYKDPDIHGGGMSSDGNVIYTSNGDKIITAISAKDGKILWKSPELANIVRSSPAISGNKIYVITVSNQLYAIEKDSGKILWNHYAVSSNITSIKYPTPVIYNDEIVLAPYSTGELYILNAKTGEEINIINLGNAENSGQNISIKDIDITPTIDGQSLYLMNQEGLMICIDYTTGEQKWQNSLIGFKYFWISGNMIYMSNLTGNIVAISKDSGKIKWSTHISVDKKESINNIMMAGSQILASSTTGNLYKLDPMNGKMVSKIKIGSKILQFPIIADRKIYFLVGDNKISIWK